MDKNEPLSRGQRIGRLTLLQPAQGEQACKQMWECLCDCGNTAFVSASNLRSGHTRSCGCLRKEYAQSKIVDLTGQQFGRLTVLRLLEERRSNALVWECRCSCGNLTQVTQNNLKNGHVKSCGCLAKEADQQKIVDLTGQRFGRLTVLKAIGPRKNNAVVWFCQCDCGNLITESGVILRQGKVDSCGCLTQERLERKRKDLTGQQFGRLTALRPTEERRNGSIVWECSCSCGNTVLATQNALSRGAKTSCGCLQQERVSRRSEETENQLIGQRYGRLVVRRATGLQKNGSPLWECQCDCGNTTFVRQSSLRSGNTKSCGCLGRSVSHHKAADLSGQRFGMLTAIRPTDQRKGGSVVWECRCDCGNIAMIGQGALRSGNTRSCGCLRKAKPARLNHQAAD